MRARTLSLLVLIAGAAAVAAPDDRLRPVANTDYHANGRPPSAKVELGRMLFFDKILSGNHNISCATCHHPTLAGGDEVALAFGEGAQGLGRERRAGRTSRTAVHERVPRNAPALFNLGAREFTRLFHDGRIEADPKGHYASGFISPAKWKLPKGLDSALAAQALFPVTSPAEMAGQKGENEVADAVSLRRLSGKRGAWALLARRLRLNPEYAALFEKAYPEKVRTPGDITFVLAANAIAAFEATAFRSDQSPFDAWLRGKARLPAEAEAGRRLFYGKANCAGCHAGRFQTDHAFHAIAMPQIGPGKNDGRDASYWRATGHQAFLEDFGRGRVTGREADRYKFRTPSLRNVELTGPWGHAGAYASLEAVVRHHLDPVRSLHAYRPPQELLAPLETVVELAAAADRMQHEPLAGPRLAGFLKRDGWVQRQAALRERIAAANELEPVALNDREVAQLLAFLRSLTDPGMRDLAELVPTRVPSSLPVED